MQSLSGIRETYRPTIQTHITSSERQYGSTSIKNSCQTLLNGNPPAKFQRQHAWKRHAELGYLALSTDLPNAPLPGGIPNEKWDTWHSWIVTDELTRVGYTGVLWGLAVGNGIGVPSIVNFSTQAQKEKYLPGVANGTIRFCLGITEPDAGSDVANIKTTAERHGDHYIVNGSKK